MTKEEFEDFIKYLDDYVRQNELCVYPDKQTYDCCDCYLCRVDFMKKVREELMK